MRMQAAIVTEKGPRMQEVDVPKPGPTELLVKVRAATLNRADLGMAGGASHGASGGAGSPLGLEWAGEVVEAGADAGGYAVGDRVMCSGLGGFADYAVSDHRRCFPVPEGMTWEAASCLPVALRTMFDALVINGGLVAGQSVMIHGASSGVGLMGLQIARKCGAATVIGTSTTQAKRDRLAEFGADHAIDPSVAGWHEKVLEATKGRGVDLVVDQVAGPGVNDTMRATAIGGRIVNVGRLGGTRAEFDFDLHALRRITYVGVTFRTRTVEDVAAITDRVRAEIWRHVENRDLALPVDRTLPMRDIAEAFDQMRENVHFGKIAVTPGN